MADEPEARHVGAGVHAGPAGGLPGDVVQPGHRRDRGVVGGAQRPTVVYQRSRAPLQCGGDEAGAERLGQHEHVSGSGAHVRERRGVGRELADHHLAEHRLGTVHRVPPGHDPAPGRCRGRRAHEHLAEQFERQHVARPCRDVEREHRGTTHGVHVARRVRRGDASPRAGVVDDRREEVDRGHEGAPVRTSPDGGVVTGLRADQEVGVQTRGNHRLQRSQHLRQLGRAELAGSTSAVAVGGEAVAVGHDGATIPAVAAARGAPAGVLRRSRRRHHGRPAASCEHLDAT